MNTQQVLAFLAVSEYKSFTRASEHLYTTQPVLSRQIASLEHELGFKLFSRNRINNITLTEQGEIFAECMRKVSAEYESMLESVNKSIQRSAKIKIGFCIRRTPSDVVEASIKDMWRDFGYESVSLHYYALNCITQIMLDGQLDVICIDESIVTPFTTRVDTLEVREERARLLISNEHPFAGKEGLSLSDFQNDTFIVISAWLAPQYIQNVTDYFMKVLQVSHDAVLGQRLLVAPDMDTLLSWCAENRGVAVIIPWSDRDFDVADCRFCECAEFSYVREVLAWCSDNQNMMVKEFLKRYKSNMTHGA